MEPLKTEIEAGDDEQHRHRRGKLEGGSECRRRSPARRERQMVGQLLITTRTLWEQRFEIRRARYDGNI